MDRAYGFNVNFFHPADVLTYVQQQQDVLKQKKAMELFTGFVWSICLMDSLGMPFRVGLPLIKVEEHHGERIGLKVHEIVDQPNLFDDSDWDVVVATLDSDPRYFYPCQVTRVVSDYIAPRGRADIFEVIEKKLAVPSDSILTLLVNVEDTIRISYADVAKFLNDLNHPVPYREIVVIGKSDAEELSWFCIRIYPEFAESKRLALTEWFTYFPQHS